MVKNALDRCIITTSPCLTRREVLNKGYARPTGLPPSWRALG